MAWGYSHGLWYWKGSLLMESFEELRKEAEKAGEKVGHDIRELREALKKLADKATGMGRVRAEAAIHRADRRIEEMASRIEAARLLVYRAAFTRDQGQDIKYESSLAKLFSSRIAVEVTGMAMQVCGSYGTMTTMPLERLYRDAKMTEIYVGIAEIQRNIIAERLIG